MSGTKVTCDSIKCLDMPFKAKTISGLVIIVTGIQFFQPFNWSGEITAAHMEKLYAVSQKVKATLVRSCYDSHCNNTRYPWYNRIPPGPGKWRNISRKQSGTYLHPLWGLLSPQAKK